MSHNDSHITTLFKKYLAGAVTVQELDELLTYFGLDEHSDLLKTLVQAQLDQHLASGVDPARIDAMVGLMDETVLKQTAPVNRPSGRLRTFATRALPYAAAILLTISVGIWFYLGTKEQRTVAGEPTIVDIAPGGNRAVLTLADGRSIVLDSTQNGIVISDENITYQDGVDLVMLSAKNGKEEGLPAEMLTLNTPRGGQYRVTLSDGTEVWLNAASTLKYPTKFDREERIVELEGEGYFEVARDTKRPFKVRSAAQEVEVLGTQFNVSAYPDDAGAQTTLVSGAVQIVNSQSKIVKLLRPGEQSVINGASTATKTVNTDLYTAWKDGFFYFDRLPTRVALSQLARWYDLELIYDGKLAKVNMFAYIERNKPLSAVLKALEKSGLKFRVTQSGEQKQLIVLGEQR